MPRILARTADETRRFGRRLGSLSRPGDFLSLAGPLGGGKTTFVQGFARGAGFAGKVTSPTFSLARLYRTRSARLHHLDLYRVRSAELANLGLEEYLDDPKGICLVEWPEAAARLAPADRLEIRFAHGPSGGRVLSFRATGVRSRRLLGGVRA